LIGNILTSIVSAFSAYVFSNSPTAFRFALYYFNMLAVSFKLIFFIKTFINITSFFFNRS